MRGTSAPSAADATYVQTIVLTTAAMLCFAANSILCRLALASRLIDAATFTTLRVFSGAAMLSLALWLQRRTFPRPSTAKPLSGAALFAYFAFFSFAYLRLDASTGALILIGAVEATMFGVALWEGQRFVAVQWVGLAMALFGFAYLVLPGANAPDPLGAVLMAASGVAWGCFSLLARGVDNPLEANAGNLIRCLLPALVVNLIWVHRLAVTPAGALLATASGALCTGLGYVVWYLALRGLPAAHAATVQLSLPALVALGGVALLAEPLTLRLVIASAAMLGGIALVLARRGASANKGS
jgi:drug/metabolite transporter (DMT)-like permease